MLRTCRERKKRGGREREVKAPLDVEQEEVNIAPVVVYRKQCSCCPELVTLRTEYNHPMCASFFYC